MDKPAASDGRRRDLTKRNAICRAFVSAITDGIKAFARAIGKLGGRHTAALGRCTPRGAAKKTELCGEGKRGAWLQTSTDANRSIATHRPPCMHHHPEPYQAKHKHWGTLEISPRFSICPREILTIPAQLTQGRGHGGIRGFNFPPHLPPGHPCEMCKATTITLI